MNTTNGQQHASISLDLSYIQGMLTCANKALSAGCDIASLQLTMQHINSIHHELSGLKLNLSHLIHNVNNGCK